MSHHQCISTRWTRWFFICTKPLVLKKSEYYYNFGRTTNCINFIKDSREYNKLTMQTA